MTQRREYHVMWTVEARATYDALPEERQQQLDRVSRILASDPFNPKGTAQLGPDDNVRKAYVLPGVMLEYVIANSIMVVVVVDLFDETHYLLD
jgi:mRNA-degrading endonuclease RelE of RelBE toxin-antitoxin system